MSKLNLNFTDQLSYLTGLHRSGWPYVMSQLKNLQNDNGVWCDAYVDRTFHWVESARIPYSRPWVGFIHHTFDTEHSDYNNVNLLKNSKFLESLVKCKGIFVFSQGLKNRWDTELTKRGFNVPVTALIHPTEAVSEDKLFSIAKFTSNTEKKVISIGAWLRDIYAIYELNNGSSPIQTQNTAALTLNKAALQGPQMTGYFKPANFFRIFTQPGWRNFDYKPGATAKPETVTDSTKELRVTSVNGELPESILQEDIEASDGMCRDVGMCRDSVGGMCRDSSYALNKYVLGAVSHLKRIDNSVAVLPTASDADYDNLLMQNIVFIKLLDAGAVNTVLECIIRATPIVVNRLASVAEVLGNDYPLFYNDLSDVPSLLTLDKITEAHSYLKALDTVKLSGAYFLKSFTDSEAYQSL